MPRGEILSEYDSQQPRRLIKVYAKTGELFRIHLVNYFLTIITLGFYRFWARTRIRRYIWSHVEFEGARFEYTGTAKELFFGFLSVFFVVLLPLFGIPEVIARLYADDPTQWIVEAAIALQWLLVSLLVPAGIYRARRYRLTRTLWRGIRGGLTGSALGYVGQSILAYGGILFSLGWLLPVMNTRLMRYVMNHTWLGSQQVSFDARAKPLYRYFLIMGGVGLILGIVVGVVVASTMLGIHKQTAQGGGQNIGFLLMSMTVYGGSSLLFLCLFLWYQGNELRHFINHTSLGPLRIICKMTGGQYVRLFLANLLTVIFTLGLGMPWVYMRYLRFMEAHLRVEGTLDFASIEQSDLERPLVGEGLVDAFDVGAI